MALIVKIGGTDRSEYVYPLSLRLSLGLNQRGTCDFTLKDPTGLYRPYVGEEVQVFDDTTLIHTFSIDQVEEVNMDLACTANECRVLAVTLEHRLDKRLITQGLSDTDPETTVRNGGGKCDASGTSVTWKSGEKFRGYLVGHSFFINASQFTVAGVATNGESLTLTSSAGSATDADFGWTFYAGDVVKYLLNRFAGYEQITPGTIEPGANVVKVVYDGQTVWDAIEELARESGFICYVSPTKQLMFLAPGSAAAPFAITDSAPHCRAITSRRTREEKRNAVYVRLSPTAFPEFTKEFTADGSRMVFSVDHPISDTPTVLLDEVSQDVGVRDVDEGKQFTWKLGEREIWTEGDAPLEDGKKLKVSYRRIGGDLAAAQDDTSISATAGVEGNSGRYERLEDATDIVESARGGARAQSLVNQYKNTATAVTFTTDETGLWPGQSINIDKNIPYIPSGSYLIDQMSVEQVGWGLLRYTCTCLDQTRLGNYVSFWKQALGGKAGGVSSGSFGPGASGGSGVVSVEGYKQHDGADSVVIDLKDATNHEITLDRATTTVAAPIWSGGSLVKGLRLRIKLLQDGTGSRAVTWNAAFVGLGNYSIGIDPDTYSYFEFLYNASDKWELAGSPMINQPTS